MKGANTMNQNLEGLYKCIVELGATSDFENIEPIKNISNTMRKELNKLFPDFKCSEVIINKNTDKQFFGIMVSPDFAYGSTSDFTHRVLQGYKGTYVHNNIKDFEPFKEHAYVLEIDMQLIRRFNLDNGQIIALILRDICVMNSPKPYCDLRDIIDRIVALSNIELDVYEILKRTELFSMICIITLHNIASIFGGNNLELYRNEFPSVLETFEGIPSYYLSATRKLYNVATAETFDTSTLLMNWYLRMYNTLDQNREIEYLLRDCIEIESSISIKRLLLYCYKNMSSVSPKDEKYYQDVVQESSRRKGLIYQMKRNGLKSIEEDLFEYNMRLRNVETQDDAILLMRQINSRMSILEDYLTEEKNLDDKERERWENCYKKYLDLRDSLSKKTVYNKKMYGLFVDYNALQNMSQSGNLMNTYY